LHGRYASWSRFGEKADNKRKSVPFANYVTPWPIMPGEKLAVEDTSLLLSEKPPYVPVSINYWIDDLSKAGYQGKISTTFNGSMPFTNVFYKTLSFTNADGLLLPAEALVLIYRPNTLLLPDVVPLLCEETHLVATNIVHGVSQISFQPELPGKTIISEERFNNGTGINFAYWQTNHWPGEKVAKASQGYAQAKMTAIANETFSAKEKSPLFARVLIIVTFLTLPLVMWFLLRKKAD
jgi:hypothetical protein